MGIALEFEMEAMIGILPPASGKTSLQQATEVTPSSELGRFKAILQTDWAYGPRAHGGYLACTLLRAAGEMCHSNGIALPHPVSWVIYFNKAAIPGESDIKVTVVRSTSTSALLQVQLWQDGEICVQAIVVQGDLGRRIPTQLPSPEVPDLPFRRLNFYKSYGGSTEEALKQEGWQLRDIAQYSDFWKAKPNIRSYLPPNSKMLNTRYIHHPVLGPWFRDQWWSFGHEEPITEHNIALVTDLFLPLHFNFPQTDGFLISTQTISCELMAKPRTSGWLWVFGRAELKACGSSRYVQDITLYDEGGQVIALARLLNVLVSVEKVLKGSTNMQSKM